MAKKRQKYTLILALMMLSRHLMRRVRPSMLIRAREQVTDSELGKLGLSREVFEDLPRQSFHGNGRPMEPMNLLLVGSEEQVLHSMLAAGWHEADPVTIRNVMRAWFKIITNGQYLTGPVTPLFVNNHMQTMAFQKPTRVNKFKQRHHLRIWRTDFVSESKRPLWVVHASYDISIKGSGAFNFPPTHRIDVDIDKERDLVVVDLKKIGAKMRGYVQLQNPHSLENAFDDAYKTDGRMAVIELKESA